MMRRIFRLFWSNHPSQLQVWTLSEEEHRQVRDAIAEMGLGIVHETRGPVPLLTFGRRVLECLEPGRRFASVDLSDFAAALKSVIGQMQDPRLRVMSPSDFPGVGYVFDADNPETWPVKSRL